MPKKTSLLGIVSLSTVFLLGVAQPGVAQTTPQPSPPPNRQAAQPAPPETMAPQSGPDMDNTKVNKGIRQSGGPTADQQGSSKQDRDVTQRIRQAVTNDKSLSTYAHNVKIITENGKVTLQGPVRSEAEKSNIEEKAASVAGRENVVSKITIAPKQ